MFICYETFFSRRLKDRLRVQFFLYRRFAIRKIRTNYICCMLTAFADLMGFKLFKRNSQRSTSTRRRSLNLSFRRRSRSSREEIRSIQNGDAFYFSDSGPKTSKEVGTALRAIGDELYRSALSLHSAS